MRVRSLRLLALAGLWMAAEGIRVLLVRLRQCEGWTRLRVAEGLCAASGVTITRHEVARWEREECVPSGFWMGWLGVVLEELAAAMTMSGDEGRDPCSDLLIDANSSDVALPDLPGRTSHAFENSFGPSSVSSA